MTDFVRRLVSGDKARFKDGELDVELGTSQRSSPSLNARSEVVDIEIRLHSINISFRFGVYHGQSDSYGVPSNWSRRSLSEQTRRCEEVLGTSPWQELLGV